MYIEMVLIMMTRVLSLLLGIIVAYVGCLYFFMDVNMAPTAVTYIGF